MPRKSSESPPNEAQGASRPVFFDPAPWPPWCWWRRICWDPLPPWLELDRDALRRFSDLELQFQARELQIEQEKVEAFRKLLSD